MGDGFVLPTNQNYYDFSIKGSTEKLHVVDADSSGTIEIKEMTNALAVKLNVSESQLNSDTEFQRTIDTIINTLKANPDAKIQLTISPKSGTDETQTVLFEALSGAKGQYATGTVDGCYVTSHTMVKFYPDTGKISIGIAGGDNDGSMNARDQETLRVNILTNQGALRIGDIQAHLEKLSENPAGIYENNSWDNALLSKYRPAVSDMVQYLQSSGATEITIGLSERAAETVEIKYADGKITKETETALLKAVLKIHSRSMTGDEEGLHGTYQAELKITKINSGYGINLEIPPPLDDEPPPGRRFNTDPPPNGHEAGENLEVGKNHHMGKHDNMFAHLFEKSSSLSYWGVVPDKIHGGNNSNSLWDISFKISNEKGVHATQGQNKEFTTEQIAGLMTNYLNWERENGKSHIIINQAQQFDHYRNVGEGTIIDRDVARINSQGYRLALKSSNCGLPENCIVRAHSSKNGYREDGNSLAIAYVVYEKGIAVASFTEQEWKIFNVLADACKAAVVEAKANGKPLHREEERFHKNRNNTWGTTWLDQ